MLATKVIKAGGSLHPLLIDSKLTGGTGITNPSIFVDKNNRILVNIRHVEYTLYHAEKGKYCHPWGPIQYVHPEDDWHLRTNNYLGELDDNFNIKYYSKVNTSLLDKEPIWTFVGLEDGRIIEWNNKLYLSGVRRDTTTNGQGRMELSEIIQEGETFKEVSRFRIPTTGEDATYCEKNWMPVLDMPFHYVKWCNPTQVVKVNPLNNAGTEEVFLGTFQSQSHDFRGGSQILTYGDYRICIVHQCDLYKSKVGRKNARYRHRFIIWDKDWNVVKYGEPFSFLNGEVEFCCGAAFYNEDLLITFGFQDNSAFLLRVPKNYIDEVIGLKETKSQIVDFFPYFQKTGKELLKLRLEMYKDKVDKFVICESNKTQSGLLLDFDLEQTLDSFNLSEEIKNKIEIIQLDIPDKIDNCIQEIDKINCYEGNNKNIASVQARVRERMQKDSIQKILHKFDNNTIFIISDADEFIDPEHIDFVVKMVNTYKNVLIKIPLVHLEGKANLRVFNKDTDTPKMWDRGMFVCTKRHLEQVTPTQLRSNVNNPYQITYITQNNQRVEDMGWHFSWMGDSTARKIKLESFCHYNDTFSFLDYKTYNSDKIKQQIINCNLQPGNISPSAEKNTILKSYPEEKLPKQIFDLSEVKKYLLDI